MTFPSLSAVRAFEAAARLGTMRAAADELGITASAVSHQVHSLEEQLQLRLFVRRGRSVTLTPVGQRYAAAVNDAFDRLRSATDAAFATRDTLRITTLPTFASEILLPLLDAFEKRHPRIGLRIEVRGSLPDLLRDPVDLAITYRSKPASGVFSQVLLKLVSSPVASPSVASQQSILSSKETMMRQTLLLHDPAPEAWDVWAYAAGLTDSWQPKKILRFDSFPGAVRAAIDGQGLLVAPLQMIAGHIRERRLQRLSETCIPSLGAYYVECRPGEETLDRMVTIRRWLAQVVKPHLHVPVPT